ncbi:MAG: hypothetical protein ACOZF0_12255 [Thermodesulfobacteriota bacterium]
MKPEQLYNELKSISEKLDIAVTEQNLRETPGIKVKSGLCKVKGRLRFIMDKHKPVRDKAAILASCIGRMPLDDMYIVPAVREFLDQVAGQDQRSLEDSLDEDGE